MKKEVDGKTRNLSGWRPDVPDHRDRPLRATALRIAALPPRVDLSGVCPQVDDQGELGSCSAFAGTAAVEFLRSRFGLPYEELSQLYLYYATRVWVAGWPPEDDSGTYIRDVQKALARHGVSTKDLWPYSSLCLSSVPDTLSCQDGRSRRATSYYRCVSLDDVRTSLADGFPVQGGFSVPEGALSAETARTGLIRYPMPDEPIVGGHAVLFIGYDDDGQLLKFQNSWGPDWGDGGFGYLPYRYIIGGLADDLWTIRLVDEWNDEGEPVDPEPQETVSTGPETSSSLYGKGWLSGIWRRLQGLFS